MSISMNRYFLVLLIIFVYSCTVSIDGAPCNQESQNCPEGQYCGSDGVCHRGNPEIKDVYAVGDTHSSRDISDISMDTYKDVGEDSLDALDDVITSGDTEVITDVLSDVGCKDECSANNCKSKSILLLCKDWDNDGCKEAREVTCGDNSECINGECACIAPYKDCDSDMSTGCETNTDENPSRCGSCSNDCGDNSVCNKGVCGCIFPYKNCDGKWSDGCEVDLSSDEKNCGDCNNDCGVNAKCNNTNCECLFGFADCDSVKGCEINLNSPSTCGSSCQNYINCGANSVCNNGFCACKSGYANCMNGWIDGCEVDILKDINNCGECNHKCQPRNVNNAFCNEGSCDYDSCKNNYIDKDLDRENGCEFWTNFPKRYRYTGTGNEIPSVIVDADNGYILGGDIVNNAMWILRVDSNGEILWQKSIQLYGEAHLKSGIPLYDLNGVLDGYLFAGTLKNANRVDVFLLRVSPEGILQRSKSYFVANSNDVFDVGSVIRKVYRGTIIVSGSYNSKPMVMLVDTDLNFKGAFYYQQTNFQMEGIFRDGVLRPIEQQYVLTGEIKLAGRSQSFYQVLYMVLSNDGDVADQDIFGITGSHFTGNSIAGFESNDNNYAIAGSRENLQDVPSGMVYIYNYQDKKWEKVVRVTVQDPSGNSLPTSLNKIWKHPVYPDNLIFGGKVDVSSGNSDALLGILPAGFDSIGQIVAIGSVKKEYLSSAVVNDKVAFVSPTDSYTSDIDMMAVRLENDLKLTGANCDKSFYKIMQGSIEKLSISSIQKPSFNRYDISNIKVQDNLNSYANASGSAINICAEPINP